MGTLLNDLRYASRQLRRAPGFTLTAVVTLALGLGATAAVYSVIHAVLLSPLPYANSEQLVGVAFTPVEAKPNAEQAGITADFIREHSTVFHSVAVMDDSGPAVNLSVDGSRAVQVNALGVSNEYFSTLSVSPALGRVFTADEDRPGATRSAILSDGLWTRAFSRDPAIVGKAIRVNEETFTVVGVMPASFHAAAMGLGTPDLWQPLQLSPKSPGYEGDNWEMIARLQPGVSLDRARQELASIAAVFYEQHPDYKKWYSVHNSLYAFRAWPLQDVVVSEVRRSLLTLMGAVLAVLLVACLNLAGLMTARTMRRSREIALRSALGATRGQLTRLMAAEGLLLAITGGLLGIVVARAATYVLMNEAPLGIPKIGAGPSAWLTGASVMALALASTAVFSLLPAMLILRKRMTETRLGGPSLGEAISQARISRALMVAQIALAMVLVSTASVLMGTFVKLRSLPSGVEPKQLTVFQVALKGDHYANTQHTTQFVSSVLAQLQTIPGVDRVAAINGLPMDRGLNVGGSPSDRPALRRNVEFRAVTPGYFSAMGISILAGRDVADSDHAGGAPVVLIGDSAAKRWWPGKSPIGEMIHIQGEENWRIVGVVADVQMHELQEGQGIVIYAPMTQLPDQLTEMINGWFPTTFALRARAHINLAEAAQQAVTHGDAEIPIAKVTTMQSLIDSTIEQPRFFSLLASGFSGFALVLTVIGLFGLLSYQVTQRTREIGVRMALGANRTNILWAFLGRGLGVAIAGVGAGLIATWLIKPAVSELLSDAGVDITSKTQNVVMDSAQAAIMAALAIIAVTLAASWLPARRAASIEPMEALRTD
jgi:predicted permease